MEKNAGFTLMELLVVVLIISILSAAALPQYQKAVAKARVSEMLPWFKKLKEGRELYLLNGGRSSCMDLSQYLDAYGVSYSRFRCSGAPEDGPCPESNTWCDGTLWVDEKNHISQGTGHASWAYVKKAGTVAPYFREFSLYLVTFSAGYTPDEKTGDLFCQPKTDWGRSFCKSIASSPEEVKCLSSRAECYRMAF